MANVTTSTLVMIDHSGPTSDPNLATVGEIAAAAFIDSTAVSVATSKMVSSTDAQAPDSSAISTASSKGVSAGTQASTADSKAVSTSGTTSVADSKALSVSQNTSVADSKAVSVAFATVTPTINGIPGFIQAGAGAVIRSANTKMAERLTPEDFGATADGSESNNAAGTDNAEAFARLSTYVNSITRGVPVVDFGGVGVYRYTGGLTFTREVHLGGSGAWLNYAGTGKAIKLGPDGLAAIDAIQHRRYVVEGIGFRNGANMTHGIYVNTFLTQPRLRHLQFDEFGNATAYGIFLQASNWSSDVYDCTWWTNSDSTGDRNWICVNGATTDGTTDNGQSQFTMLKCMAVNQGFGAGTCVYLNGRAGIITNNNIAAFGVNVWLASNAFSAVLTNNSFETRYGPCLQYGDATGPNVGGYAQDYRISNNRCNLHYSDFHVSYPFIAPTTVNTGMQYLRLRDNLLEDADPSVPMVVQNSDKASQTGNQASGNRGFTILHTAGVVDWTGDDGP